MVVVVVMMKTKKEEVAPYGTVMFPSVVKIVSDTVTVTRNLTVRGLPVEKHRTNEPYFTT
jgi:hypothetical protein